MSDTVIKEVLKIFNNEWNKQVILYGPPGTSKTYSSTIIAAAMLAGVDKKDSDLKKGLIEALKNKPAELEEEIKSITKKKNAVEAKEDKGLLENELLKKEQLIKELTEMNLTEIELFDLASCYLKCCDNYKLVQFHPSYSYEDFVRGITVEPKGSGVSYEVESKIIEKFCVDNIGKTKVLIIDEINRAPLASVLGELIYGLEYRDEKISTPYELKDKRDLIIPKDLYIIGTMNTADRSIGSMDYAVRRRFAFIPVGSTPDAIKNSWGEKEVGEKAVELYIALMDSDNGIFAEDYKADKEMDVEDIKIGHTYFLGKKEEGLDYLKYRVQYQILPIYQEYIKDGLINKEGLNRFKEIIGEQIDKVFANDIIK